jgi:ketosteroid isomerase-like protein
MKNWILAAALALPAVAGAETNAELREQVKAAETAFAKSMADRDHAAFSSFLAEDTVFLGRTTLRGKAAVAEAWKRFYAEKEAPFSWRPERVEVLDDGTLGLSTGPVFAPNGDRAGQYNSTWRRGKDGQWKIIFDNGCDCGAPPAPPKPPAPPVPPTPPSPKS